MTTLPHTLIGERDVIVLALRLIVRAGVGVGSEAPSDKSCCWGSDGAAELSTEQLASYLYDKISKPGGRGSAMGSPRTASGQAAPTKSEVGGEQQARARVLLDTVLCWQWRVSSARGAY